MLAFRSGSGVRKEGNPRDAKPVPATARRARCYKNRFRLFFDREVKEGPNLAYNAFQSVYANILFRMKISGYAPNLGYTIDARIVNSWRNYRDETSFGTRFAPALPIVGSGSVVSRIRNSFRQGIVKSENLGSGPKIQNPDKRNFKSEIPGGTGINGISTLKYLRGIPGRRISELKLLLQAAHIRAGIYPDSGTLRLVFEKSPGNFGKSFFRILKFGFFESCLTLPTAFLEF